MNAIISDFQQLNERKRQMVVLKAEGKTHRQIANATGYSKSVVDHAFCAGGDLQETLAEYNRRLADEIVARTRAKLRQASDEATEVLLTLMRNKDPIVQFKAASKVLSKSIPDERGGPGGNFPLDDDEIPPAVREAMEAELAKHGLPAKKNPVYEAILVDEGGSND